MPHVNGRGNVMKINPNQNINENKDEALNGGGFLSKVLKIRGTSNNSQLVNQKDKLLSASRVLRY